MSSSSAYNNVLLKSPVPTQAVAAPRRAAQDEYSPADFRQTFKNLSDNSQHRANKAEKSTADKTTQAVDSRKTILNDTRKLNEERIDRANVARKKANEKIDRDKSGRESVPKEKPKVETHTDKKSIDKARSLKETKSPAEQNDESTNTSAVPPEPFENKSSSVSLAVAFNPEDENSEAVEIGLELDLEVNAGIEDNSSGEKDLSAADVVANAVDGEADALMNSNIIQAGTSDLEDVPLVTADLSKMMNGKTSVELAESQTDAVTLSASKISGLRPSVDNILSEAPVTADENPADLDADMLAAKTFVADKDTVSTNNLAKAELQQVNPPEDPKTVFEKMLQTVSKSVVREEDAPTNALQNNALHSSPSLTDSFARFNDAQLPATRGFVVQTAVPVPVGQPQWSQAVGEKVLWLAAQNVSSAEINLHPKDLGPMQVRVSVNQEQTTVNFTSHHPMVREVLDQNLNRLRDMFSEQGLNLVNVDVSDKSFSRQQGEGKEPQSRAGTNNLNEEEAVTAVSTIVPQRLVDHYA